VGVQNTTKQPSSTSSPQKIQEVHAVEPAAATGGRANHSVNDEPMIGPVLSSLAGSSVNKNAVGKRCVS
jgi:hypothetical protein